MFFSDRPIEVLSSGLAKSSQVHWTAQAEPPECPTVTIKDSPRKQIQERMIAARPLSLVILAFSRPYGPPVGLNSLSWNLQSLNKYSSAARRPLVWYASRQLLNNSPIYNERVPMISSVHRHTLISATQNRFVTTTYTPPPRKTSLIGPTYIGAYVVIIWSHRMSLWTRSAMSYWESQSHVREKSRTRGHEICMRLCLQRCQRFLLIDACLY